MGNHIVGAADELITVLPPVGDFGIGGRVLNFIHINPFLVLREQGRKAIAGQFGNDIDGTLVIGLRLEGAQHAIDSRLRIGRGQVEIRGCQKAIRSFRQLFFAGSKQQRTYTRQQYYIFFHFYSIYHKQNNNTGY